jgi:DNA-directed RNA polymerase specialized sigma24 family protein
MDKPPHDPDSFDRQIQRPELRIRLRKRAQLRDIPSDDCEDIASDTLEEAIRKQTEYNPARGSISSWIIGINENVIRNYRRKQQAQKRKAEGGVVSLHASLGNGHGRDEPKDAVAEENSELSVEVNTTSIPQSFSKKRQPL